MGSPSRQLLDLVSRTIPRCGIMLNLIGWKQHLRIGINVMELLDKKMSHGAWRPQGGGLRDMAYGLILVFTSLFFFLSFFIPKFIYLFLPKVGQNTSLLIVTFNNSRALSPLSISLSLSISVWVLGLFLSPLSSSSWGQTLKSRFHPPPPK